jgi:hypothetical protein
MGRVRWKPTLAHSAAVVESYDTGVTLRQLFYRLVADGTLPNIDSYYRRLSAMTAEARRERTFPDLLDRTSRIEVPRSFAGPVDALRQLRDKYRRDRTAGQEWTIVLGVEKAGMSEQLDAWFTDPLGLPHVALGGYASQTLCDRVRRYIEAHDRPAVLIYAGDFDPTGEDIDRDFAARVARFDKVVRVALNADQIAEYRLPENVIDPEATSAKLRRDPRARQFEERHGSLVQFEVDALAPEALRDLYRSELARFWDHDAYERSLAREADERQRLAEVADEEQGP